MPCRRTLDSAPRHKTRLAGFLVLTVATAVRAELLDLQPIRVVAPVLAGDVVAVLTLFARQGDLGAHIGGGHSSCLFLVAGARTVGWGSPSASDLPLVSGWVAVAGLEPATQRL